ncbi:M23 family metallopeptidase [Rhodococcus sp. BP-332]|uniref:M23 family metallopeptidase n=1 Tax=Rhodococcus sp. BP-332 TaxID=2739447 RepID=UPI0027E212BF|nr:M23 family metallopeptidase [Rhodococcus sp. BP-332]
MDASPSPVRRRGRWGSAAMVGVAATGALLFAGTSTAAAAPALPPLPALPAFQIPGVPLSAKQQAAILAAVFDATGVLVQEVAGLVLGDITLTPVTPDAAPDATSPFQAAPLGVGGSRLPLTPGTFEVTSGYGGRNNPTGGGRQNHEGIDLGAAQGTTIYAVTGGTVTQAGDAGDGYGNLVKIQKGDTEVLYGHQSRIDVAVGDTIAPGQAIGAVGSTGDSNGPHLHFEVRRGGEAVDPVGYLTALGLKV